MADNRLSTELDIETTGLDPWKDEIVSIQLGDRYFDCYPGVMKELPPEVKSVVEDPTIEKIIHNAHFEYKWFLVKFGVRIQNIQDSQVAAFLTLNKAKTVKVDEATGESRTIHTVKLKPLCQQLFNADASEFDSFDKHGGIVGVTRFLFLNEKLKCGTGVSKDALYEQFKSYAIKDNKFSRMVLEHCRTHPEWSSLRFVYNNELALIPRLVDMEIGGMRCDREAVLQRIKEVEQMLEVHEKNLYDMLGEPKGEPFDLKGRDVGDRLHKAGVPLGDLAKDGHYRCDSKYTLPRFMNHPAVRELVIYRKLAWTLSTCLKTWAELSADGSPVRTSINSMGAVHGRLSSSDPNLMNVPKRMPSEAELAGMPEHIAKGYRFVGDLRRFFIPDDGFTFYMLDWSQIELVLAAFYSRDEAFLRAFRENKDAHRQTAADALNIPIDQVTEIQRQNYKEDGFGILYGSGTKAIAERIVNKQGIPFNEAYPLAQARYKGWFTAHPGIRKCNDLIKDILLTDDEQRKDHERLQANQKKKGGKTWEFNHCRKAQYRGYLRNHFGRIWRPDEPGHHYKGLEAIVSGTATGDMTKIAMNKIGHMLAAGGFSSRMVLPVHDEIILCVKNGEEHRVVPAAKAIMEDFPDIQKVVPIRVDIDRSKKNWLEKEKVYDSKTETWKIDLCAKEG